jgi:hypothetical protein
MSGNWQFTSDVFNGEILTAEFADTSKVISPDEDEIYYAHAVNNDGHVLVVTTGEFLLLVFSRWKMSNDTALKAGIDNFQARKAFLLPYYASSFADDRAFNALTLGVKTPLEVSRISYTDNGEAGLIAEVEGQERTSNASADRWVVDSLTLVRDGSKLLVSSHMRAPRDGVVPSSPAQKPPSARVEVADTTDRDEFVQEFDAAWEAFRDAWEGAGCDETLYNARVALAALYSEDSGVDAMTASLSHSLDGRFDFPGPEWREGDDALHLIRAGSIDKDPVIEEITLVGGPDGYRVASHTRKNP